MSRLSGKKILFLGASTYFYDAAKYAKREGAYIIAVDIRPKEECIVKEIADEHFMLNTTDVDAIMKLSIDKGIDGIYAGASEVNIPIATDVCEKLNMPQYCTKEQWNICTNKALFKKNCIANNVPVSPVYSINNINDECEVGKLKFPVVTKPVDNNGSTGITICESPSDFVEAYKKAKLASKCGDVLIEKKMNFKDSLIAHYTAQDGEIIFCGLTDKESKKILDDHAPVMSIQFMPSKLTNRFKEEINSKIVGMLKNLDIKYGPIWIEVFYDDDGFYCNEIGYRYGGSLTYFPVEYFYGINQMNLLVNYIATGLPLYENFGEVSELPDRKSSRYCILPIQVKPGKITKIEGLDELLESKFVHAFVQSHIVGDSIEASGTTHQVFGYIHLIAESDSELYENIKLVNDRLKIYDENSNNMVNILYLKNN